MSPFGNLYQVPVAMDRMLGESDEVVFNAGSHTDTVKMRYQDLAGLIKPKTGSFGQPFSGPAPKRKAAGKRPSRPRKPAKKRRRV